jgi:hypothetical protein
MAVTGAVDLGLGLYALTITHDPTAVATDALKVPSLLMLMVYGGENSMMG